MDCTSRLTRAFCRFVLRMALVKAYFSDDHADTQAQMVTRLMATAQTTKATSGFNPSYLFDVACRLNEAEDSSQFEES